jgi:subtilase family serine protease
MTSNVYGEHAVVSVVVKNVGLASSPETKTRILVSNEAEMTLADTRALAPEEEQLLDAFDFIFAAGTSHNITAIADANNQADESNENNNEKSVMIVISPSA